MKKSRFDIANYFLILIIINAIIHYLYPIKQIIPQSYTYIGLIIFIIGWIPNIWLGIYFRKIKTSIPSYNIPSKLITSGLFRFSRNPIYLGMIIALIGEMIFLGSLITFAIPSLFFILINKFNIKAEEAILKKKFGKAYLDYKKRVRRWI
tara:strand:- start:18 stop:467 length:450 start_codon:yes stop_codon:yes gene_type:complete